MASKPSFLTTTTKPRRSRRRILLFSALALVVVLGLALGLGLGLTLGRNSGSDNSGSNNPPQASGSPLPTPNATLPWTPSVNDTWQIVLLNPLDLDTSATSTTPNVSIFDIDLFTTTPQTISTLHRLGKKVICYFSAGSYEPDRPDSAAFVAADKGKGLDGWPGEKWLNLSSANVRSIMHKRVSLAAEKGCDGIDPDNVDGYQNDNGLGLTANDSIDFMAYLSALAVPLNLTLGLKNAGDIIPNVLPIVHFSVNEQCVQESECSTFHAFIDAGKPVFHIEYPDGAGEGSQVQGLKTDVREKYCGGEGEAQREEEGTVGFSTVLKRMDLDGWVEYCDGVVETTALNGTDTE